MKTLEEMCEDLIVHQLVNFLEQRKHEVMTNTNYLKYSLLNISSIVNT